MTDNTSKIPSAPDNGDRELAGKAEETAASPNPFDPENLALKGNPAEAIGVMRALVHVRVDKPSRQQFFRVHPDPVYRCPVAILDLKTEGEIYLVTPEVASAIPGEIKVVLMTTCISRQGVPFLWHVPMPSEDGRELAWHVTAREAAARAETKWVRMVANMSAGAYDVYEAPGEIADPNWPDYTFKELLEVAFGNGRLIDRVDHPVLKQLLGQA